MKVKEKIKVMKKAEFVVLTKSWWQGSNVEIAGKFKNKKKGFRQSS